MKSEDVIMATSEYQAKGALEAAEQKHDEILAMLPVAEDIANAASKNLTDQQDVAATLHQAVVDTAFALSEAKSARDKLVEEHSEEHQSITVLKEDITDYQQEEIVLQDQVVECVCNLAGIEGIPVGYQGR